ncbi:MAG TPA: hypothetical protein VK348_04415 [Planctomycetota bacterium]|nr:hypothetical protein [Planctomycetota bacterium]
MEPLAMDKKDTLVLLLVLAAGGYAVHANWPKIRLKLGLNDLNPGRIRAMELAKKSFDFDQNRDNTTVLTDRRANGEIQLPADPWSAEPIDEGHFRVFLSFTETGEPHRLLFNVDIHSGRVVWASEDVGAKAAPR